MAAAMNYDGSWVEVDLKKLCGNAEAIRSSLGGAELMELPDAGHWPWMERADVVDRVAAFVDAR